MAEDHRRVEPRSIIGTGMSTDPERVEALLHERERRERGWRHPPEKGFGAVLEETPAAHQLDEERADERRPHSASGARGRTSEAPRDDDGDPSVSAGDAAEKAEKAEKTLPRVPPDPRMQRLQQWQAPARGTRS